MNIMKATPVIIHGPEGCGKTRNAEYFARAYSKTKIAEADDHHVDGVKFSQHGTMHCAGLDGDNITLHPVGICQVCFINFYPHGSAS